MKLYVLLAIGIGVLLAITCGPALADNGPHGGYTPTTDACAGCHRTHTAVAAKLLLGDVPNLCYSCHGTSGTGADTNVVDGIYLSRDLITESPAEGVDSKALLGGGFVNALMDTNWDGSAASASTTSSHIVDGGTGTVWGNGAIGSGAGASIALSCTSCHDPHGNASSTHTPTYRLLRSVPSDSGSLMPVDVVDEVAKSYTVVTDTNNYFVGVTTAPYTGTGLITPTPYAVGAGTSTPRPIVASRAADLSYWCAECHTRYMAGRPDADTASGDSIFAYRHRTISSSFSCMRCHVAHGSSASMVGFAATVPYPNGSAPSGSDVHSALLRLDNRGVCEACHHK